MTYLREPGGLSQGKFRVEYMWRVVSVVGGFGGGVKKGIEARGIQASRQA